MYAVATVHFKRSVKVDELISRLAAPTALALAITETIFETKPAIVVDALTATTVYSHLGPSAVCLLLKQGDKQVQLHVECVLTTGSFLELKHELSRVLSNLSDAAEASGQDIDSVEVVIYANDANRIISGRYLPFAEIMGKQFCYGYALRRVVVRRC